MITGLVSASILKIILILAVMAFAGIAAIVTWIKKRNDANEKLRKDYEDAVRGGDMVTADRLRRRMRNK